MLRRLTLLTALLLPALPLVAQDATSEEFRKLQGVWTVTAAEQRGRPLDVITGGVLTIAEHAFSLKTASGNQFTGDLRLDPSTTPKQLNFVHANQGPVWEGIYSITGDVLRLNYVEAGGQDKRPTLFATSADSAGTVIVMRRGVAANQSSPSP